MNRYYEYKEQNRRNNIKYSKNNMSKKNRRVTRVIILSVAIIFLSLVYIFFNMDVFKKDMHKKEIAQTRNKEEKRNQKDIHEEKPKVEPKEKENKENEKIKENDLSHQDEKRQKETDKFKYNKNAQRDIENIYDLNTKVAYLTFDDGPSSSTEKLLELFKEEQIHVTFFMIGRKVKDNPEMVKKIYNEGHCIANHSCTHNYAKLYENPKNALLEYYELEKIYKGILGENFNSNLFRFPGGSSGGYYHNKKMRARKMFKEKNIAFIDWNCLTNDGAGSYTYEKQIRDFEATRKGWKPLIILQHDTGGETVLKTTREIIKRLKKEGYVFKNFNDILLKEVKQTKKVDDTKPVTENNI